MKKILLIIFQFAIVVYSYAQTTYVPDDFFEQKLINMGLDDVLDDYVQTANIDTLTVLDFGSRYGSEFLINLTGIEDFISLKVFYSDNYKFSSIDLSNASDLESLSILRNDDLTSINLANNNNLKELNLSGNPNYHITDIDLSNNQLLEKLSIVLLPNLSTLNMPDLPNLKSFELFNSNITSVDVSNSFNLKYLIIGQTNIQSITFNNPNLEYLILYGSQNLNVLDLTSMVKLHTISISYTTVSNINFGNISKIMFAYIHNNSQLTQLNFNNCNNLEILDVNDNPLLNLLDVRNGNQIHIKRFNAQNNPSLSNILVDDPNGFYIANWLLDANISLTDF